MVIGKPNIEHLTVALYEPKMFLAEEHCLQGVMGSNHPEGEILS